MKQYKNILFDLDRTIWDFEKNAENTLHEIFLKYELNSLYDNFDTFISTYRKINEKLWDDYRNGIINKEILRYKRFQLTLAKAGKIDENLAIRIGDDYVYNSPKKNILFPNTHEVLTYLKSKYKLYIITNGFKEVQNIKLKNSNLSEYFTDVFISEIIGIQKPNPGIFDYVVSKIKAEKDHCIMIGDDIEVDIKGARSANIDQILFNPCKIKHHDNPTHEISNLIELKKIL